MVDFAGAAAVEPLATPGALIALVFFRGPLLAAPVWRDIGSALLRPFV